MNLHEWNASEVEVEYDKHDIEATFDTSWDHQSSIKTSLEAMSRNYAGIYIECRR